MDVADYKHILRANVADSSNGTMTVVAAVAGKKIKLVQLLLATSFADQLTLKFGSTTLFGPFYMQSNGFLAIDIKPLKFISAAGEAFTIVKGLASTPVTALAIYELQA